MKTTRLLQDTERLETLGWRSASQEMLSWKWDLNSEICIYGAQIADHVVKDELTSTELGREVDWARGLFYDAMRRVGADWSKLVHEDAVEAFARRLAFGAGLNAQTRLINDVATVGHWADYESRLARLNSSHGDGLARVEARDLGMGESLVKIVGNTLE